MLHVTNGTSVSIRETGLGGDVLAWADVLHEGPVPAGISDIELRHIRALFLDSGAPGRTAEAELMRRDDALAAHQDIVLWFEHDLYDQLQLIQVLDRLRRAADGVRVSLICTDRYLGPLPAPELAALWPSRHAVSPPEFELAADAWRAFRSADPMELQRLLARDTAALPFLAGALRRHLQQFPSVESGLARTERQLLEILAGGSHSFRTLFPAEQRREERIFMGDTGLLRYLRGLCDCRAPLALEENGFYRITDTGREVLAGRADRVRLNGINRWLGGVHLIGHEVLWRWDDRAGTLRRH